ncbi:MAG: hypothetical protein H0V26_09520 [Solirubrobacterales bacterium]|nr:hypothetical protein [Solirubrobacterales bacterium]
MATKKVITVEVSPNTTLTGPDGMLRRAGETFDVADDDTVRQWVTAGWAVKVPAAATRKKAAT